MTETDNYLIEEAVGNDIGIPMTPQQEFYLREFVDPQIEKILAELDKEIERRRESDDYQRRTLPEL